MIRGLLPRGGFRLLGGLVIPGALSSVTVLVTSAVYGPGGRGQIAFVMSLSTMIMAVGAFSLYLGAARSPKPVPSQYLDLTVAGTALVGLVVCFAGVLWGGGLLTPGNAIMASVASIASVCVLFSQRVCQAHSSDLDYLWLGAVPAIISSITVIGASLLGVTVLTLLRIWISLSCLFMVAAILYLRRRVPMRRLSTARYSELLRASLPVGISGVGTTLLMRSDIVILGLTATEGAVGAYSLAVAVSGVCFYLAEVYSLRVIAAYSREKPQDGYAHLILRYSQRSALTVGLLALGIALGSALLLPLVLPTFKSAVPALAVLCLAAVPASVSRVVVSGASMVKDDRALHLYSAASFGSIGLYLIAARWNGLGMALASLVSYSLIFLLLAASTWWSRGSQLSMRAQQSRG